MLKRIINKIKYHLIKEIVLVDSENIGYQIPEEIPKHTLVYLFISDPFIDEKIKNYKNNKHIKLINISNIRKECVTKNIMDFCIVAELTNLLSYVSKKTRIVICSKDRGYDASILYLKEKYPNIISEETVSLPEAMSEIYTVTGNKFIVIIDEWDILIRDEANNRDEQENYINFLRGMFKGTEPTRFISLAYLTGILPIKKMKTQSALNNFDEFTMLDAGALASYIGFTELEVEKLCDKYQKDFAEVKRWYDGYMLENQQVYNPKAVVSVMLRGNFQSYWSQTGTYEVVVPLINMDFDGLKQAIIEMVSGSTVEVDTGTFQNDTVSFSSRDDVITYLIHLGYLAYDQRKQCAFIPNEEIRQELLAAAKKTKWNELQEFEYQSEQLLEATLDREETLVADYIEQIHMEYASAIQYHNENSLSSVLTIAYLSAMKYYFKPIRELPTGRGFSDFVFIPKEEYRVDYPALVVELKWNKSAHTELQQIKDKKYPESLLQYTGNILLVGINYDKKSKAHECVIEEYKR